MYEVTEDKLKFVLVTYQCLHGLWRGSADARLLGLCVRIPSGAWMSVYLSVVCCQKEVSATGRSLVQRSPTECGVSVCDREASTMRKPLPITGCRAMGGKKSPRKQTQLHFFQHRK